LHGEEPVVLVEVPKQAAEEVQDTPLELRWRERVAGFKIGERLLDANGRHLQLIWRSPNQDHFVLVDGQGREAGSYGGTQLGQFLASGQLQMVGSDSGPSLLQSTLQDIVGRLYNEIAHARSHDELTGALNRRSFEVALAQCLAGREQNAFIMLHLGMFALLNRQLGSAAGDACLRALVEHLRSLLPEGAQIGRLAGVDFAICLPDSSSQAATELADSLMKTLEEKGFLWEGRRHPLSLSLGVLGSRNRHDVAGVLSDLHSATTAARESGGNALHVFEEDADAQYGDLLAIAARIDSIIEQQQLGLRLQQIAPTDPASEELPHYELLLVMENDLQLMDFINAAERYQRMPKVDRWVLKRVFLELERHPQVWQHSSSLSINLSGSSLNDDKLPGFIESLFEQHAVEPQKICFELTETSMVANLAKTADMMRYLQGLGCSFSIDDFGVGFSSFDYLKRLPADYVKIDGSFVRDIENSPGDLAMVRSINEIAHALGRKTVAEFVETPAIRQYLLELGVDYVQGYGVERPRPLGSWLSQ
jgi:diguanylate cyclase (GGDEF)-like protein